ncbi:MAG: TonB-dependent receptor [Opitutus sp.]
MAITQSIRARRSGWPGLVLRLVAGAVLGIELQAVEPESNVSQLKRLSIEELFNVEITSVSRAPERLLDSASAIQVIFGDDIHRSGATTLPEALRLANNLNVAQKNSHDWGVSARGFNTELANKLLVLMDGRTLYTPLFSGVRWDVQDYLLEDLDRIEVISGPGGSLWGANAVNGVINITSKTAAQTQGLFLEAGLGDQLRQSYAFRYGGILAPSVHYRVYAKHLTRDGETRVSGVDFLDDWTRTQVGFRLDAAPSRDQMFTLQGDLYDGKERSVAGAEGRVNGGNLLGRWSRTLANASNMQLQVYFDRAYFRLPVGASVFNPAGNFTDSLDTVDLDFQHQIQLGLRQRVVWGLGYRRTRDDSRAAPGFGFMPAFLEQELSSAFVQDEIDLGSGFGVTAGTKIEHTDYTGFEVEPNVRLSMKMDHENLLWAAVSRAVRTPSRIDHDLRQPYPSGFVLQGGENFESENVIAYELGYRTQTTARWSSSIAAFYNQYDHIRSARPTPVTTLPLVFANDVEGRTYGAEFTTIFQVLEWWRLTTGFTLLREDLRVRPGRADLNNALNETSDPEHQWSVRSAMTWSSGLSFDVHLRWVDTLHNNVVGKVGTVPSYTEANVRLGWKVNDNLELSAVGQNLLHDHHAEFGIAGPDRVEIERSIYGRVTWHF